MTELLAALAARIPGGGSAKPREYLRWVQASVGQTLTRSTAKVSPAAAVMACSA